MGNNNSLPIINSHVHIIPLTLKYLIHISSPHPRCCLPPKPINISSRGGISATIPIHHPQSEHICSSRLVFPNSSSYWSSQLCRGMKIPTFYHPRKHPKPILTWSGKGIPVMIPLIRHPQSERLWSPQLVFPGFPLPIWAHSSDAGVRRPQCCIILESTFYRNQSSPEAEEGSPRRFHRFTARKANAYDHLS